MDSLDGSCLLYTSVEMLPLSHPVKQQVVEAARSMMEQFRVLRDVGTVHASVEETCISKVKLDQVALSKGCARYSVEMEAVSYTHLDQTDQSGRSPEGFQYGSVYTSEDIDKLLAEEQEVLPGKDEKDVYKRQLRRTVR